MTAVVETWTAVCCRADLVPERGVAALVDGRQVAVFLVGSELFAIDHHDPATAANVLARGLVGSTAGRLYVASPLQKDRYDLRTGEALDRDDVTVAVHPVREVGGTIEVRLGE